LVVKLDDKHSFKHRIGIPYTKSLELLIQEGEDPNVILDMIDDVMCKKYNGWSNPTVWWEGL
jgi:hypothetical protein